MTLISYSITTLMIYSLVFLFVYLDEMLCDLFFHKKTVYVAIFKGGLFGLSLSVVIYCVKLLGLTGMPDGRFSIVLLTASILGPLASLLSAIMIWTSSIIFGYYEILFLTAHLFDSFLIGTIVYFIKKKNITTHVIYNMIGSLISVLCVDLLGDRLINDAKVELGAFKDFSWMIVVLVALFAFLVSVVLLREKHRTMTIKEQKAKQLELTMMNQEISTLNEQLIESEKKYRLVLKASNEGFIEYNHVTKILNLSDRALEICDYLFHGNMTTLAKALNILDENDSLKIQDQFIELKQTDESALNLRLKIKQRDDVYKHVLFNGMIVREQGEIVGVIGSLVDISEQVEKEEVINRLAYYDEITGLLNENAYFRDFNVSLHEREEGYILFCNVVGYLNLEVMGQTYQNLVRMHIGIVLKRLFSRFKSYQLSDGYYCVIFPKECSKDTINHYYENLKVEMSQPFHFKDINIPIQMSCIYFEYPMEAIDSEGFLSRAKSTLHQQQKTKYYELTQFDEEKHLQLVRSNRIENLMLQGISQNEFFVVFQPQINRDRTKIHGFEALLRWNSKEFGLISPSEFIPISEQNGSIVRIGQFVLESVCRFIKEYEKQMHEKIRVSVNVSFLELVNPKFAIVFSEYVKDQMIEPYQIALEITETAMVEYIDIVQINVKILRALGFEIHLDDFGTGFSSLNHLTTIKIDYLKIDKSFIDKITVDETTIRVVESLISLSHNIGIRVIAEGVEESEQIDVLTALGCDVFQGYYFSKPQTTDILLDQSYQFKMLIKE